eukprot:6260382-Pyramimonas_sp.AAC.1
MEAGRAQALQGQRQGQGPGRVGGAARGSHEGPRPHRAGQAGPGAAGRHSGRGQGGGVVAADRAAGGGGGLPCPEGSDGLR